MKKIYLLLLIFSGHELSAQSKLKIFKTAPSIQPDIERVVNDYYGRFFHLLGEKIDDNMNTIEYKSKLLPPGALQSTIIQLKNQRNAVLSENQAIVQKQLNQI